MQVTTQPIGGNTMALVALGIVEAILVVITLANIQLPVVSNHRIALAVLLVVGMAMCSLGMEIARYGWTNPFNIAGILIGAAILTIGILAFLGIQLPFVANERAAILAIAVLMVIKLALAGTRALVS